MPSERRHGEGEVLCRGANAQEISNPDNEANPNCSDNDVAKNVDEFSSWSPSESM